MKHKAMSKVDYSFSLSSGVVLSAILQRPDACRGLFVLGHGSGSNMRVPILNGLADALADRGIATLRFQYPYSQHPDFVPYTDMPVDDDAVLVETIRAAFNLANEVAEGVPVFVGGHSMGGYAATLAAAEHEMPARAIIALEYPRKGDPARSSHLARIERPILVVQGTKDALGTKSEIQEMVRALHPRAQVRWIEGGSHGFAVPGAEQNDILRDVADHVASFIDSV